MLLHAALDQSGNAHTYQDARKSSRFVRKNSVSQTVRIKVSRVHKLSGLMWATRACDFVIEGFLSIRSRERLPAQITALKTRAPPHGEISYFSR